MVRSTRGMARRSRKPSSTLAVHEAVDAQPPRGGVQLGHRERGVDPVEVGGRRDEGRDPRHPHRDGGQGRRGVRRCGQRHADGADAVPGTRGEHPSTGPGEDGDPRRAADRGEHLAAAHSRSREGVAAAVTDPGAEHAAGHEKGRQPCRDTDEGGHDGDPRGVGPAGRGRGGHDPQCEYQRGGQARSAQHGHPRGDGQGRDHDGHRQQEHELVVGAEGRDGEVLQPPRRQVDERLADGDERARRGREDLGDRVGHRDGDGTGGQTGERGRSHVGAARPAGLLRPRGLRGARRRHAGYSAPAVLRMAGCPVT